MAAFLHIYIYIIFVVKSSCCCCIGEIFFILCGWKLCFFVFPRSCCWSLMICCLLQTFYKQKSETCFLKEIINHKSLKDVNQNLVEIQDFDSFFHQLWGLWTCIKNLGFLLSASHQHIEIHGVGFAQLSGTSFAFESPN